MPITPVSLPASQQAPTPSPPPAAAAPPPPPPPPSASDHYVAPPIAKPDETPKMAPPPPPPPPAPPAGAPPAPPPPPPAPHDIYAAPTSRGSQTQEKIATDQAKQAETRAAVERQASAGEQTVEAAYNANASFVDARAHQGGVGRFVESVANAFGVEGSANNVSNRMTMDAASVTNGLGSIGTAAAGDTESDPEFLAAYKKSTGVDYDPENPLLGMNDQGQLVDKDGKTLEGGVLGDSNKAVEDYNSSQAKGEMIFNIVLGIATSFIPIPIVGPIAGAVSAVVRGGILGARIAGAAAKGAVAASRVGTSVTRGAISAGRTAFSAGDDVARAARITENAETAVTTAATTTREAEAAAAQAAKQAEEAAKAAKQAEEAAAAAKAARATKETEETVAAEAKAAQDAADARATQAAKEAEAAKSAEEEVGKFAKSVKQDEVDLAAEHANLGIRTGKTPAEIAEAGNLPFTIANRFKTVLQTKTAKSFLTGVGSDIDSTILPAVTNMAITGIDGNTRGDGTRISVGDLFKALGEGMIGAGAGGFLSLAPRILSGIRTLLPGGKPTVLADVPQPPPLIVPTFRPNDSLPEGLVFPPAATEVAPEIPPPVLGIGPAPTRLTIDPPPALDPNALVAMNSNDFIPDSFGVPTFRPNDSLPEGLVLPPAATEVAPEIPPTVLGIGPAPTQLTIDPPPALLTIDPPAPNTITLSGESNQSLLESLEDTIDLPGLPPTLRVEPTPSGVVQDSTVPPGLTLQPAPGRLTLDPPPATSAEGLQPFGQAQVSTVGVVPDSPIVNTLPDELDDSGDIFVDALSDQPDGLTLPPAPSRLTIDPAPTAPVESVLPAQPQVSAAPVANSPVPSTLSGELDNSGDIFVDAPDGMTVSPGETPFTLESIPNAVPTLTIPVGGELPSLTLTGNIAMPGGIPTIGSGIPTDAFSNMPIGLGGLALGAMLLGNRFLRRRPATAFGSAPLPTEIPSSTLLGQGFTSPTTLPVGSLDSNFNFATLNETLDPPTLPAGITGTPLTPSERAADSPTLPPASSVVDDSVPTSSASSSTSTTTSGADPDDVPVPVSMETTSGQTVEIPAVPARPALSEPSDNGPLSRTNLEQSPDSPSIDKNDAISAWTQNTEPGLATEFGGLPLVSRVVSPTDSTIPPLESATTPVPDSSPAVNDLIMPSPSSSIASPAPEANVDWENFPSPIGSPPPIQINTFDATINGTSPIDGANPIGRTPFSPIGGTLSMPVDAEELAARLESLVPASHANSLSDVPELTPSPVRISNPEPSTPFPERESAFIETAPSPVATPASASTPASSIAPEFGGLSVVSRSSSTAGADAPVIPPAVRPISERTAPAAEPNPSLTGQIDSTARPVQPAESTFSLSTASRSVASEDPELAQAVDNSLVVQNLPEDIAEQSRRNSPEFVNAQMANSLNAPLPPRDFQSLGKTPGVEISPGVFLQADGTIVCPLAVTLQGLASSVAGKSLIDEIQTARNAAGDISVQFPGQKDPVTITKAELTDLNTNPTRFQPTGKPEQDQITRALDLASIKLQNGATEEGVEDVAHRLFGSNRVSQIKPEGNSVPLTSILRSGHWLRTEAQPDGSLIAFNPMPGRPDEVFQPFNNNPDAMAATRTGQIENGVLTTDVTPVSGTLQTLHITPPSGSGLTPATSAASLEDSLSEAAISRPRTPEPEITPEDEAAMAKLNLTPEDVITAIKFSNHPGDSIKDFLNKQNAIENNFSASPSGTLTPDEAMPGSFPAEFSAGRQATEETPFTETPKTLSTVSSSTTEGRFLPSTAKGQQLLEESKKLDKIDTLISGSSDARAWLKSNQQNLLDMTKTDPDAVTGILDHFFVAGGGNNDVLDDNILNATFKQLPLNNQQELLTTLSQNSPTKISALTLAERSNNMDSNPRPFENIAVSLSGDTDVKVRSLAVNSNLISDQKLAELLPDFIARETNSSLKSRMETLLNSGRLGTESPVSPASSSNFETSVPVAPTTTVTETSPESVLSPATSRSTTPEPVITPEVSTETSAGISNETEEGQTWRFDFDDADSAERLDMVRAGLSGSDAIKSQALLQSRILPADERLLAVRQALGPDSSLQVRTAAMSQSDILMPEERSISVQQAFGPNTSPELKAATLRRLESNTNFVSPSESRAAILKGLNDEAPTVRFSAIKASNTLPAEDFEGALSQGIKDNDPAVRAASLEKSQNINDENLSEDFKNQILEQASGDPAPAVQAAVRQAKATRAAEAENARIKENEYNNSNAGQINKGLNSSNENNHRWAIDNFDYIKGGQLGDELTPIFNKILDGNYSPAIKLYAVNKIGNILQDTGAQTKSTLISTLKNTATTNTDPDIQSAVWAALIKNNQAVITDVPITLRSRVQATNLATETPAPRPTFSGGFPSRPNRPFTAQPNISSSSLSSAGSDFEHPFAFSQDFPATLQTDMNNLDPSVRLTTVQLASSLDEPAVASELVRAGLKDPDPAVIVAALEQAHLLTPAEFETSVIPLLDDVDTNVKAATAQAVETRASNTTSTMDNSDNSSESLDSGSEFGDQVPGAFTRPETTPLTSENLRRQDSMSSLSSSEGNFNEAPPQPRPSLFSSFLRGNGANRFGFGGTRNTPEVPVPASNADTLPKNNAFNNFSRSASPEPFRTTTQNAPEDVPVSWGSDSGSEAGDDLGETEFNDFSRSASPEPPEVRRATVPQNPQEETPVSWLDDEDLWGSESSRSASPEPTTSTFNSSAFPGAPTTNNWAQASDGTWQHESPLGNGTYIADPRTGQTTFRTPDGLIWEHNEQNPEFWSRAFVNKNNTIGHYDSISPGRGDTKASTYFSLNGTRIPFPSTVSSEEAALTTLNLNQFQNKRPLTTNDKKLIKNTYHKWAASVGHPDRNGDVALFQMVKDGIDNLIN